MKKYAYRALAASGLVTMSLGLALPALAAPAGAGSAQDTVNKLEAEGYRVIVNKVGSASLDQCVVTAVRPGRQVTEPGTSRTSSSDPVMQVLYTTVNVDVKC